MQKAEYTTMNTTRQKIPQYVHTVFHLTSIQSREIGVIPFLDEIETQKLCRNAVPGLQLPLEVGDICSFTKIPLT